MQITFDSRRTNKELMQRIATVSKGAAQGITKDLGFDSWVQFNELLVDIAQQRQESSQ